MTGKNSDSGRRKEHYSGNRDLRQLSRLCGNKSDWLTGGLSSTECLDGGLKVMANKFKEETPKRE